MRALVRRLCTLATGVALALPAAPAAAQCDDWRSVPDFSWADIVKASTVWDPDGAGPLPPRLVIAGRFITAGWPTGVSAASIASYDGASWQPLGAGLVGPQQYSAVYALAVYNGQLIAGGTFETAGASPIPGIARWNGSSWQALGAGLGGLPPNANIVHVRAMTVYNGELIASGGFLTAGGVTVRGLARWNGTSWAALGNGTLDAYGIQALAVYNGQLIAAGAFSAIRGVPAARIAAWNGSSWSALGAGIAPTDAVTTVDSDAESLAVYGGELVVGGRFTSAGGVPASSVAAWNGSTWRALGAGVEDTFNTSWSSLLYRGVFALAVHNGQLLAAGRFTTAGGAPATSAARWNGAAWSPLGPGVGGFPSGYADEGAYTLQPYGADVYIGGAFPNAGAQAAHSLARWNGSTLAPAQGVLQYTTTPVLALCPWGGGMMVGGDFRWVYMPGDFAFNGVRWNGLGVAPGGIDANAPIHVMAAFNRSPPISSDIYVAGDFTTLQGTAANRIATRNSLFGLGWSAMGAGFNGTVRAIERHNGSIYAVGDFTASGATPIARIARWTGTAWEQVGFGLNGTGFALRSYGGSLYVGGAFTSAGGSATGGLARLSGSAFLQVGGFFQGNVYTLAVHNNELVIGGLFPGINNSPNLARYNGSSYSTYGVGGTNAPVRAATTSNNTLVVGGDFTMAGGIPAQHLARWNGSSWSDIRAGTEADGPVYALSAYAGELHVGGAFRRVKGGAVGSMGYARFLETGIPWIAQQTYSTGPTCQGGSITLQARAAAGYAVTYTWRRNGAPLSNGPGPGGSTILGAGTDTLTIAGATPASDGEYTCHMANTCGSATSYPVNVVICYANCDCSTASPTLNVSDFGCFLSRYAAGDPYANCDNSTQAPVLNVQDFGCFLTRYAAGCP